MYDDGRREISRKIELVDAVRSVGHGRARVQQDRQLGIGLTPVALEIRTLGAGDRRSSRRAADRRLRE